MNRKEKKSKRFSFKNLEPDALLLGPMMYRRNASSWSKRYCVLHDGKLHCFKKEKDDKPVLSVAMPGKTFTSIIVVVPIAITGIIVNMIAVVSITVKIFHNLPSGRAPALSLNFLTSRRKP